MDKVSELLVFQLYDMCHRAVSLFRMDMRVEELLTVLNKSLNQLNKFLADKVLALLVSRALRSFRRVVSQFHKDMMVWVSLTVLNNFPKK